MINTKVLLKAMSFMFLPTISLLGIIFCWFLDWQAFISFITAKTTGAGLMRLVMLGLEIGLTIYMYKYYLELWQEAEIGKAQDGEDQLLGVRLRENVGRYTDIQDAIPGGRDAGHFEIYKKSDTLFVIKLKPRESQS